jgi:hypothetical protein
MKYISVNLQLCYQDIFHLCCKSLKSFNPQYQTHICVKVRYIQLLTYVVAALHKLYETPLFRMLEFYSLPIKHLLQGTCLMEDAGCHSLYPSICIELVC